ncbi:MAG TPA: hypothetical protein VFV67_12235 [Actinophytocola sp.]|uniref:hypothetical protein n=1 Tax=Actinophytocola sp. TaxID=1872138 RepID=UPI002DB8786C|nr:hypothetical protein [Actinophytocola sp.]HEU5471414.1 hypothetical protein [Actinophytocola sp.]
MPVPSPVRNATYAVWAILALAVLRVVLTIAFKDDLVDAYIAEHTLDWLPRDSAAEMAPQFVGVSIVSLALTALLAFAAINLPKGKNWARIVAVVFAALVIVGVGLAFLAPSLVILQIINVVMALASAAVIVLLFTADANRFFAARTGSTAGNPV